MNKIKYQKGNTGIVILIVVVAVIFLAWWLIKSGYTLPGQIIPSASPTSAIQNKSGLDTASRELDSQNLNQMDPGINQISVDSASF